MMRQENTGGASGTRQRIISAAAIVAIVGSASFAVHHYFSAPSQVPDVVVSAAGDEPFAVTCESCEAHYSIPAKEYMARMQEAGGVGRAKCDRCGDRGVWRARPPIEVSDEAWRSGFAGQDMLISELKAWHKAHPEAGYGAQPGSVAATAEPGGE